MKQISIIIIAAICAICLNNTAVATIRTVNNASIPVSPGQYSTIAAALSASSAGDTLLVAGSGAAYDTGTLTINKKIVIIGEGYNPRGANRNSTKIGAYVALDTTGNGSTIMGCYFNGGVGFIGYTSGTASFKNYTFIRNYILSFVVGTYIGDSVVNLTFINNIFGPYDFIDNASTPRISYVNGCYFYNNIFLDETYVQLWTSVNVVYDHNLFLWGSYGDTLLTTIEAGIIGSASETNNIYYNVSGNGNNCLTYAGTTIAAMTGTGDLNNTNPLLNSIFNSSTNIYLDFNLDNIGLKSTSPCINAGSDGTNIGPTGGLYPIYATDANYLTGEPAVPSVRQVSISGGTTVSSGATITVNVTGKSMQ